MTRDNIRDATIAATAFLAAAKDCVVELNDNDMGDYICGTKASGRLRRVSMELTRALARMRRP